MMRKNLWLICAAAAVMAAGSTVYAADFSDGETPVISAEESQLMDSAEIFDDGNLEEQEPVFGDTVSETELPAAEASASSVPLDEAHFPNKKFREYLATKDENKNQILDCNEIQQITSLNAGDIGTYQDNISMEGYQYLTSLEDLTLLMEGKHDVSLTLDFSSLPNLKKLKVNLFCDDPWEDGIAWSTPAILSLTSNSQLEDLTVDCDVRDILLPTDCNIRKYSISCWDSGYDDWANHSHDKNTPNRLVDLIPQMPELEEIFISNFGSIALDTSRNPHLRILDLDGTGDWGLSSLFDFSKNPELEVLRLHNMPLLQDKLDLSNCTRLQTVDFTNLRTKKSAYGSSIEETFSMIDLGNCHPKTVHVVYDELHHSVSSSGYIDFSSTDNWNPDRLCPNNNRENFVFHDSKLFPVNLANDQLIQGGKFYYYLNDAKTAVAEVPFTMTDIYNPEMATGLTVTKKSGTSLTCKWNPVKRPHDRYVVYLQDSKTDKTIKRVTLKKNVTSTTFKGLKSGQRYKLVVRAYRTQNNKNYYSPHYDGNIYDFTIPKTPSVKAKQVSDRKVKLYWKKNPAPYRDGISQYGIYCRKEGEKSYQRIAKLSDTKDSFTTGKLKKNTTYYFRIRSFIREDRHDSPTSGSYSKTIKITIK
ncbi:MAG: fibronectin type III domain-containing protein [Eubacteriales bacterium]|nr:fibronectin type III domain-containing protein [Eubacteriales bacterium]